MEYIISEVLKRKKRTLTKLILVGIVSIILLNICITFTNTVGVYQNLLCIFLVCIYCIIMYFVFRKMIYLYSYNLSNDCIDFRKHIFKKSKCILTVKLNNIRYIDKFEYIKVNPNVQKTYYLIYGFVDDDCYFCEYESNNKSYRFVFKPSERLIRILERKIGLKNNEQC